MISLQLVIMLQRIVVLVGRHQKRVLEDLRQQVGSVEAPDAHGMTQRPVAHAVGDDMDGAVAAFIAGSDEVEQLGERPRHSIAGSGGVGPVVVIGGHRENLAVGGPGKNEDLRLLAFDQIALLELRRAHDAVL